MYQTLTFHVEDTYSDNDDVYRRHILRAHRDFHGSPKYDWFVICDTQADTTQGIDHYKLGQVCLFLEVIQNGERWHLAYVNWFLKCKRRDKETGMCIVDRSHKYNIIGITAIVQSVHLQPLFEEQNSAIQARSQDWDVYSFDAYVINKYSDRASWEMFY